VAERSRVSRSCQAGKPSLAVEARVRPCGSDPMALPRRHDESYSAVAKCGR
jgi:hypothetical protein